MTPLVTIAIRDVAGSSACAATLAALARHTPQPHEVVLFAEKPAAAPAHFSGRVLAASREEGAPAALNRLLTMVGTPYVLLLESGALVTDGWLGRLLAALDDPAVGLCGPSTNMAWNEQQALPRPAGMDWPLDRIDAFAAEVAARYGDQRRPLDTLHSLGDFCYMFRCSVAERLGGFDESYGVGPCWEIDFNTRAARAGFSALWVAAAYVHRRAPTPGAVQALRQLFATNKRLYQDRFCGLRLRGERADYEQHCRGETCEHFAPPDLIRLSLGPVGGWGLGIGERGSEVDGQEPAAEPEQTDSATRSPAHPLTRSPAHPLTRSLSQPPLISCIMPTRNRRRFIAQAIQLFLRQDYPNCELIVVDDGDDRVADLMPADPRVRYVGLDAPASIGAKRNLACGLARGAIIAHWDDDDWYAPHRLRHQAEPLLTDAADLTGLETACFFDLDEWRAWTCTAELHRRLFTGDVHGGTLVYRRLVWEELARYPDISVAEDALFLRAALRHGARLERLPHDNCFAYVRHGDNAWRFSPGSYLDAAGWDAAAPGCFIPPSELTFYEQLRPRRHVSAQPASARPPVRTALTVAHLETAYSGDGALVTCIMPTYNRRAYVPQAIRYFQRQDYPNRELLILDDGSDAVEDLIPSDPRIRYIRLDRRLILGAKRNLACELARGTIIIHWDDDDWIAPHRISYQLAILQQRRADLCGAGRQMYYSPSLGRAWLYEYPAALRRWLAGNTLCYRKAFWARNRFPEVAVGEDTHFAWSPQATNAAVTPDHDFYVGLIHAGNTSRKNAAGVYWRPCPLDAVLRLLHDDLDFYRALPQFHE